MLISRFGDMRSSLKDQPTPDRLLKAVADPIRLRILTMLGDDDACVCQIVAVFSLAQSAVSRHLRILRDAGLIVDRPRGRWTFYRLARARPGSEAGRLLALVRESPALRRQSAADRRALRSGRIRDLLLTCPPPPRRRPRGD